MERDVVAMDDLRHPQNQNANARSAPLWILRLSLPEQQRRGPHRSCCERELINSGLRHCRTTGWVGTLETASSKGWMTMWIGLARAQGKRDSGAGRSFLALISLIKMRLVLSPAETFRDPIAVPSRKLRRVAIQWVITALRIFARLVRRTG